MSSIATRHKLIKKIKDEKFDEEKLQQYVLLTQIGAKDFQAAVIDSDDNRLIFFEDYVFNEVSSQAELQEALQSLFDSHEYLLDGFWKKRIEQLLTNGILPVIVLGPNRQSGNRRDETEQLWPKLTEFISSRQLGLAIVDLRSVKTGASGELPQANAGAAFHAAI